MKTPVEPSVHCLFFYRTVCLAACLLAVVEISFAAEGSSAVTMLDRLENTVIENVEFESASLDSALRFLESRVDGLQFVILDNADHSGLAEKLVTLSLRGVPASTVLSYLCRLTGCQYEVEKDAVLVGTGSAIAAVLTLRASRPPAGPRAVAAMKMMQAVHLDSVEFSQVDVETALNYLRKKIAETSAGAVPNFVIIEPGTDSKTDSVGQRVVSLKLKNVAASTAFGYLADLAQLGYRLDGRSVVVGDTEQVKYRPAHQLSGGTAIQRQMAATQVSEVRFDGISLADAIEGVRFLSRQGNADGLNVIDRAREIGDSPVIHLHLDRVSLAEVVNYIAEQSGTRVSIEQLALVFEKDPSIAQRAKAKQAAEAKALAESGGRAAVATSAAPASVPTSTSTGTGEQVSSGDGEKSDGQALKFDN